VIPYAIFIKKNTKVSEKIKQKITDLKFFEFIIQLSITICNKFHIKKEKKSNNIGWSYHRLVFSRGAAERFFAPRFHEALGTQIRKNSEKLIQIFSATRDLKIKLRF